MGRRQLVAYRMGDGQTVMGCPGSLPELRFIYHEIFTTRVYASHGIRICDGDCIVDVGANVGLFTKFAMSQAQRLRILAFEPIPVIFQALQANVALAGEPFGQRGHDVQLRNHGVLDCDKQMSITFYPKLPGNSTVYPEVKYEEAGQVAAGFRLRDVWSLDRVSFVVLLCLYPVRRWLVRALLQRRFGSGERYTIRVQPLCDALKEARFDRVDLLKIDVEGAELDVLKGMDESNWQALKQLVMEIAPGNRGRIPTLQQELVDRGFSVKTVEFHEHESSELPCTLYATRPR